MCDSSPAMRSLREQYHRECADPHIGVEKRQSFGDLALNLLGSLVNSTAELNQDQIGPIVDVIHAWARRDWPPKLEERLPIATFINSCRT